MNIKQTMAFVASIAVAAVLVGLTVAPASAGTGVHGIDVSHHQGRIDWKKVRSAGIQFSYIKATEGTTYRDPNYRVNFDGARKAGVIPGAYHFALPHKSSGATQARHLLNSGGWLALYRTLPAALDLESGAGAPYYRGECWGLSKGVMTLWIADFLNTYKRLTGRTAVIYTTTSWWKSCTGNYNGFRNPLWLARYQANTGNIPPQGPGAMPAGWKTHTIWQYTSRGQGRGHRRARRPQSLQRDAYPAARASHLRASPELI